MTTHYYRAALPVLAVLFVLSGLTACSAPSGPKASSVRVVTSDRPGPVLARVKGREIEVAPEGWKAWLARDGRVILYSGSDGAGGFEDEGQSLYSYHLGRRRRQKLMAGTAIIDHVTEASSRSGRLAYVVSLTDGAVGAPTTSIVDPARGEIARLPGARLARIADGHVVVEVFEKGAFDTAEPEGVQPVRTLTVDLDHVLTAGDSDNPTSVPRELKPRARVELGRDLFLPRGTGNWWDGPGAVGVRRSGGEWL